MLLFDTLLISSVPSWIMFTSVQESVLSLFLYNPLSCTVLNNINFLFVFSSREYFLLYKIIIYLTSVYHFLAKKIICRNLSQFTTIFFWISFVPCDLIPLLLRKANCTTICVIFFPCIPDWRWRWEPKPKGHPSLAFGSLGLSASQLLMHENNGSFTADYRLFGNVYANT